MEQLWFTALLNRLFGGPVAVLLTKLGIEAKNPHAPIANSVAMEVLVFLFLVTLFLLVRSRLSVDKPGALQHVFEAIHGFITDQSHEIIGHHSDGFTAFLVTLGMFILTVI